MSSRITRKPGPSPASFFPSYHISAHTLTKLMPSARSTLSPLPPLISRAKQMLVPCPPTPKLNCINLFQSSSTHPQIFSYSHGRHQAASTRRNLEESVSHSNIQTLGGHDQQCCRQPAPSTGPLKNKRTCREGCTEHHAAQGLLNPVSNVADASSRGLRRSLRGSPHHTVPCAVTSCSPECGHGQGRPSAINP